MKGLLLVCLSVCLLVAGVFPAHGGAAAGAVPLSKAEAKALIEEAQELFREADEVRARDPDRANELYRRSALRFEKVVREDGFRNGRLFYNIGNAWFRQGDLGRAILNYRRAEEYIPNDSNLQQNLRFARLLRKDRFEETDRRRLLKTLFFWHYDLPASVRSRVFGMVFVAGWILAALRLFWRRASLTWSAAVSGGLAVLFLGSLIVESVARAGVVPGVVLAAEVVARKGDSSTYEPAFEEPLHAGTEFDIVEDRGEWLQVMLPDDRRCWLPRSSVELVRP